MLRLLVFLLILSVALFAQAPPTVAPAQSPVNATGAPAAQQHSRAGQPEPPSVLKRAFAPETWSQWALLLLAIVGAFFAYHTVVATKNSADAARASAEALMRSERGLVLVTIGSLPDFNPRPDSLEFLYITPLLKNYGKTAATITRILARPHQIAESGDLPAEPEYLGDRAQDINATVTIPPDIATQPLQLGISSLEWPAIRTGQKVLYIYGFVQYNDAFDRPHETRFCYLYHVPGGFNPNPTGFYLSGPPAYNRCS